MKLNRFVRNHIFKHNAPEPAAAAPASDPAPLLDDAAGGGGSDTIESIAGLIGGHDTPAATSDPEPQPSPDATLEPEPEPQASSSDAELATLRARVAELEATQAKPNPEPEPEKPASASVLKSASEATNAEQLAAHEDYCERMRAWALENWDGASIEGADGNPVEFTAAQVRQQFARFDNELRKAIPTQSAAIEQRAAAAEQRKAVEADAVKVYPWIAQPESEDGALYAKFTKALPAISELPLGPLAIADMIAGFRARTRKAALPAVSPAPRTTARPPVTPAAATGGTAPAKLDAAKALELLRASGGDRRTVADVLLATGKF